VGGFLVPWLTGVVGDGAGIAAGVGSMALWCALITAGGLAALRLRPSRAEGRP
jgi:fucose permease